MIYISRKEHFNAAHKLFNPAWSVERNVEIFGPCANDNWHGHNFDLIVTVKGSPDPDTGFVVDLKKLSTLIRREVIEKLDHKNINLDVDFMRGMMASTELLCIGIFNQLKGPIEAYPGVFLHSVRLYETENNSAEYFGD